MDTGDAFAFQFRGKAQARGEVDVVKPGDPGHGKKASSELPQSRGLRAEIRDFQHGADDEMEEQVIVFDTDPNDKKEDIVLFTGSKESAKRLYDALGKLLKK